MTDRYSFKNNVTRKIENWLDTDGKSKSQKEIVAKIYEVIDYNVEALNGTEIMQIASSKKDLIFYEPELERTNDKYSPCRLILMNVQEFLSDEVYARYINRK